MSGDNENTQPKRRGEHLAAYHFKPGNPGRPKGARNKLQEDFLGDVLEAWQVSGKGAITSMIADKPSEFVKMVAGLMPKEANLNINDYSEMTDDELAERIRTLASQLAPFLTDGTGIAAEDAEGAGSAQQSPRVH
jgi:hypothetical protein